MKPDDFVYSGDVTMKRIRFAVERFAAMNAISLRDGYMGLELRRIEESCGEKLVLQLLAKVATRKLDVKTVKFPDGAWQFVKHNATKSSIYGLKIVRWFLNKYPVRYIEITLEANAYNPDIAIPDHDTFVEIVMRHKYTNGY